MKSKSIAPIPASALWFIPQAQAQISSWHPWVARLRHRPVMLMAGAALMVFAAAPAQAATYNWQGADNALWSIGPWGDTIPGAGNVAVFSDLGAGATVDIDVPSIAGGILFNNNVLNQVIKSSTGQTLTLNNGASIAPITVAGSHTISANFTAERGIAVTGGGKLTLSGTATGVGGSAGNQSVAVDVYGTGTELDIGGSVTLADSRDTHVVNNGKLTINGTYVTSGHDQIVGTGDHGGGTGDVVLSGTGSWTHTGGGVFVVGNDGVANVGTFTINDSAVLDLSGNMPLFIAVGWGGGSSGAIVQNGGLVKPVQIAQAWRTGNGPGVMLGQWNNNACSATYSLNGGILQTPSIGNLAWDNALNVVVPPSTYGATAVLNLNGGVIQASDNDLTDPDAVAEGSAHLIFNTSHTWVRVGGAKINTSGFNNSVNVKLEHDSTGPAIDGGLTKLGLGTLTLLQDSTYTGPTVVKAGTLVCTTVASLAPAALEIDASATLELSYSDTQSVTTMSIAGVAKAPGIYGAVGSPSPIIGDSHITGLGTVTVTESAANPYATWAALYPGHDLSNPAADLDGDGLSNFTEFAFGLDPTKRSSSNPISAPLDKTSHMFSYSRYATSGLTYTVLTSTDLVTWSPAAVTESVGAADAHGTVTVQVTLSSPPAGGKLFVRVSAQ